MIDEHLSRDLRKAGFTDAAAQYPRDEFAVILLCAFNGIEPELAPNGWKYFPNKDTRDAWTRVAEAARKYLER